MQYISSDTNVWIDFQVLHAIEIPFRLDCIYLMSSDAANDECLSPGSKDLIALGLQTVDITDDEFLYAESLRIQHPQLSVYDVFALAISIFRNIELQSETSQDKCGVFLVLLACYYWNS